MARGKFSLVVSIGVWVWFFGGCPAYLLADDKPTVKVAKHIVEGSTVTAKQMEDWFKKAKDNWAPWINLEQVGGTGHVDNVSGTDAGRVAGAVNVYGTSYTDTAPGNPGRTFDQNYIEMGPGAPLTTLKHEFVHWFGAYPDNATTDHGTPIPGQYPGYPAYPGYDTNGDGVDNASDRGNIAYPGTARTGEDIDPEQGKRAAEGAKKWLKAQEAIKTGRGKDSPAPVNNVPSPQCDLTFTQFYCWGPGPTQIYLKGLVVDMTPATVIGFWIDSDQDPATGEPGTGYDYQLAYHYGTELIEFAEHDGFSWVSQAPLGITRTLQFRNVDAPRPPAAIGVELSFSELLLARRGANPMILVQSFSTDAVWMDIAPTTPQPISTVPTPVMISGQVTLQDTVLNPTGLLLQMEVRLPGNPAPLMILPLMIEDSAGDYFTISTLSPGVYDLSIKESHWLRNTLPLVDLTLESNWANFSLINGDVDGNNHVDTADLSTVLMTMDLLPGDPDFNHSADLDGDNEVASTDLSIQLTNMDTMGDP